MNRPLATLLVVLAGAGCDLPAAPGHPRLWTLFDLQRLAAGSTTDVGLVPGGGIPGGVPVSHFVTSNGAGGILTLSDAFTEGVRAAYVTPELWSGFAQVWVQPMYLAVNSFSPAGAPQVAPDARPIFSVGPGSTFYSPFWQQIFFDLPAGASAGDFTSSRQVIESGAALHPAASVLRSLAPSSPLGPIAPPVDSSPFASFRKVGNVATGKGWLDGQEIAFFDLGAGTFRWDAARAVVELPLFTFTMRDANGNLRTLDGVPTVGGAGPLGSGASAPVSVPLNQPRYGALWRAYTVTVPAKAGVFAPPQPPCAPFLVALTSADVPVPAIADEIKTASAAAVQRWVGRVALDASCFDTLAHLDPASGPGGCVWLDSQAAIEREIDGEWIRRTDLLLDCPFVSYADGAVPP